MDAPSNSTGEPGAPLVSDDDFDAQVAGVAALDEPVRRALYRYVVAQPGLVSRDQAAEGTGVPRHVAKFHLDKLEDDGLLEVEFRRPAGRGGPGAGRPAKLYRRSPRELAVSLPERRYEPRTDPDGLTLTNCPFHALARDYTDLVCGMNLDLVDGLLARLERANLEARLDPAPGRCCVTVRRRPARKETP